MSSRDAAALALLALLVTPGASAAFTAWGQPGPQSTGSEPSGDFWVEFEKVASAAQYNVYRNATGESTVAADAAHWVARVTEFNPESGIYHADSDPNRWHWRDTNVSGGGSVYRYIVTAVDGGNVTLDTSNGIVGRPISFAVPPLFDAPDPQIKEMGPNVLYNSAPYSCIGSSSASYNANAGTSWRMNTTWNQARGNGDLIHEIQRIGFDWNAGTYTGAFGYSTSPVSSTAYSSSWVAWMNWTRTTGDYDGFIGPGPRGIVTQGPDGFQITSIGGAASATSLFNAHAANVASPVLYWFFVTNESLMGYTVSGCDTSQPLKDHFFLSGVLQADSVLPAASAGAVGSLAAVYWRMGTWYFNDTFVPAPGVPVLSGACCLDAPLRFSLSWTTPSGSPTYYILNRTDQYGTVTSWVLTGTTFDPPASSTNKTFRVTACHATACGSTSNAITLRIEPQSFLGDGGIYGTAGRAGFAAALRVSESATDFLMGLLIVFLFLAAGFGITRGAAVGAVAGALVGVGLAIAGGFFPLWFLFLLAVVSIIGALAWMRLSGGGGARV